jgi:hypothetical protein
MSPTLRIDTVSDLRETVTYRISFHDLSVNYTIDCSSLVGNSASIGTPRLELLSVKSNTDKHVSILNVSGSGTESLAFAVGIGKEDIGFPGGITDNSSVKSSQIKIESHGNTSGYMFLTFVKKGGFANIGSARRKPLKPNAYN